MMSGAAGVLAQSLQAAIPRERDVSSRDSRHISVRTEQQLRISRETQKLDDLSIFVNCKDSSSVKWTSPLRKKVRAPDFGDIEESRRIEPVIHRNLHDVVIPRP